MDFDLKEKEDMHEVMDIPVRKQKSLSSVGFKHFHLLPFDLHIETDRFYEISFRDKNLMKNDEENNEFDQEENYQDDGDYD